MDEAAATDSLVRDSHHHSRREEAPQEAEDEHLEKGLGGVAPHVPPSWGCKRITLTPILRSKRSSKQ